MPSFPLPVGPRPNRQLLIKRARMQGFIILDHYDRYGAILERLTDWYRAGHFRWRQDVTDGLENAPAALVRPLAAENTGKALVSGGADPCRKSAAPRGRSRTRSDERRDGKEGGSK